MRVALLCRISRHTIEQPIFKKSVPGTTPPAHTGVRWKSELGRKLSDEWWQRALDMVNSTSSCARLTLIQFKVLHRIHFSKAKLFNTSYTCDRCSLSSASHTHVCFLSKIKLILVLFLQYSFKSLKQTGALESFNLHLWCVWGIHTLHQGGKQLYCFRISGSPQTYFTSLEG